MKNLRRFAVVQLYRGGLGTQEELAGLFRLHVNTVQKYVADFTRAGLLGLVPQRSGPKAKWDEHVSMPSIRQVLLETGIIIHRLSESI